MSDLRQILGDIHTARGALTPAIVVDEARPATHPLHSRFEWDDTVAGEKYRQVQAAQIIRSVRVTYTDAGSESKSVRAFLPVLRDESDATGERSTYAPIEDVLADPFTRQLVLREFDREWKTFRARYGHLQEFAQRIARDLEGDVA